MVPRLRLIFFSGIRILFIVLFLPVAVAATSWAGDADADYRIGPEDILEISVWKDEALTRMVVVRPDGKITFPLAGELAVGGRTVAWLTEEIDKRLSGFMSDVEVTVSVNQVNSLRVYLIGKVGRPGEYKIGRSINVMQALALAGGLAPFADEDDIFVLRTETDGHQLQIPFDYKAIERGTALEQNIPLQPGDVVVVP